MKRYYIVEINDLWYFGVSNTSVLERQYHLRRNVYLLNYPFKSPKVEPNSPYPSCIYRNIANIRQCWLRHRGVYKYVVFVCCWLHRQGFYKLGVDRQCARSARCGGNYKYIHLQLSGAKWLDFREKWNKEMPYPSCWRLIWARSIYLCLLYTCIYCDTIWSSENRLALTMPFLTSISR